MCPGYLNSSMTLAHERQIITPFILTWRKWKRFSPHYKVTASLTLKKKKSYKQCRKESGITDKQEEEKYFKILTIPEIITVKQKQLLVLSVLRVKKLETRFHSIGSPTASTKRQDSGLKWQDMSQNHPHMHTFSAERCALFNPDKWLCSDLLLCGRIR